MLKVPTIEEQNKIGDFLIKFGKFIEKQSDKIEILKRHKQELLQKMFV